MASATGISIGAMGYIGIETESLPGGTGTPGLFVTPTDFIPVESKTLASTVVKAKPSTMQGDRATMQVRRSGKRDQAGAFTQYLFPTAGMKAWSAALGQSTAVAAVASDTVTSFATAAGVTTMVLTGGTGNYQNGQFVLIDTAAAQEIRVVESWVIGTKTMMVKALSLVHAPTTCTIVGQAQRSGSTINPANSAFANQLPTLSIEDNMAGLFSWQYPNCLVGKLNLKGSGDHFALAVDVSASTQRIAATTPTAFNATANLAQDMHTPYNYNDGYIRVWSDPAATGTSTLQTILATNVDITVDNHLIKKDQLMDGTNVAHYYPGPRDVMVSWDLINQANRSAAYQDLLITDRETPFFMSVTENVGTATAPVWVGFSAYAPSVNTDVATDLDPAANTLEEHVAGAGMKRNGLPEFTIYAITGAASTYIW